MIEIILTKHVIKLFIFYFVNKDVCKDTLELTVQQNVLILVTETTVRELATAALIYAISPGAAVLFKLLPQVGTLNFFFFNFLNMYTFPSLNN